MDNIESFRSGSDSVRCLIGCEHQAACRFERSSSTSIDILCYLSSPRQATRFCPDSITTTSSLLLLAQHQMPLIGSLPQAEQEGASSLFLKMTLPFQSPIDRSSWY